MAVAIRSSNTGNGFGSVVLTKPAGTVATDVLYALVGNRAGTTAATAPSGWTAITSWDTGGRQKLYRKVVDGSEGASFTFTTTGSDNTNGVIFAVSGADNTTPEDVAVPTATSSFGSTSVNAPSITTVSANAMVVHMYGAQADSSSLTVAGDTTIAIRQSVGASSAIQAVAGASGVKTMTMSVSSNWFGQTFAIRPASGVDPVPGAPDPVTSLNETHDSGAVSLTWSNPGQSDFAGVMVRRAAGSTPPADASSGTLVSDVAAPGASVSATGLGAATTYSFSLFAHDGNGNFSAATSITVTTNPSAGAPGPVTAVVYATNVVACSLTWTNPTDSSLTGVMVRRATGTSPPATVSAGTLVSDVATPTVKVVDNGLTAGTTYSYSLFAHDAYGNYATAATTTISTLPSGVPPANGTRPSSGRPGGLQRLTSAGSWVPLGQSASRQGDRSGFVPGPNVLSRTPHYRNPFFITDTLTQTSRIAHLVMFDATDMRFVYGNYCQTDTGNDITVRAGLELSGAYFIPITFNGARDVVIPSGQQIISDPVPFEVLEGQTVYTRTRATATSGRLPTNIVFSDSTKGEGRDTSGNDLTTSGSITATGFLSLYGPCSAVATPSSAAKPVPMVALIGDSIMASESPASAYESRMANCHIPHVNFARTGEKATFDFDRSGRAKRLKLMNHCTHAIVEYGINDLSLYTGAQTKAGLYDVWRVLALRGIKVYATTITPNTASTDGWTTLANQTPFAGNTGRVDINDWIRGGAPLDPTTKAPVTVGTGGALVAGQAGHPLVGYFEIADTVESARNSGKWALNAGTTDGLHPGYSGQALMQAPMTDVSVFYPKG